MPDEAWQSVSSFVDWHNHQHRNCGSATAIRHQRAYVYQSARGPYPTSWSPTTRYWSQLGEVWINKPPEEHEPATELTLNQAAKLAAKEWQLS